jgi:hypothetical protein
LTFVFFADRDLGRQFPSVLAAAGLAVERHDDVFSPRAPDEEWLEYVGRKRRIAITHDSRIRYAPNELNAVIRHRVALLIVIGKARHSQLAANFVNTMPRILEFLSEHEPPFIAKVYRPSLRELTKDASAPGKVSLWYP